MTNPTASNSPPRLVLDTCVCLDLFHFEDARCGTLRAALESGLVEAVTNGACREEWCRVLRYEKLGIAEERRVRLESRFDASVPLLAAAEPGARPGAVLPACSDPDDQKFLELARDSDAIALVTKDRALLRLWRRLARAGLFAIVPPEVLSNQHLGDPGFWTTMRGTDGRYRNPRPARA